MAKVLSENRSDIARYLEAEESRDARQNRRNALRLAQAMLKHRGLLAAACLVIAIGAAAALVEPRLFGYAIDEAIIPRNANRLVHLVALFLLVITVRVCAMFGQAYLFEALGQMVTQDLRVAVFSRLQRLPLSIYDRNPAGRLMTRVTNDIVAIAEVFSSGFVLLLSNALLVIGTLVWLIVLEPRLGLITISVFPFMVWATVRFSRQLQVSYRQARSRLSALNAFLAENLMGIKVVHLFNREAEHLNRFSRLNQWYTDAQISSIRTYAFLQPTITAAAGASIALLVWFGGREVQNGAIKLGVLVAFFAYALMLFRPLRDMVDKWTIFLAGLASAERIFGILEWPVELPEDGVAGNLFDAAQPYLEMKGHIVFENVWFAYEGEHWILRNLNLTIEAGTRLGIVGRTGSGKTTLIHLLLRFYEPQKGRILIDGVDIRQFDKRRLRKSIGLVQQDVFLFSGSIAENVTLFSGESHEDCRPILDDLGFPDNRFVTERGGNLSTGERQLISFARVYRTDPRIWILDEATSNMDSHSESILERAVTRSSIGKTVIQIAHRLATIRSCSQVIVLHAGQIVEKGSHSELLAMNGLYARLHRYQQLAEQTGEE